MREFLVTPIPPGSTVIKETSIASAVKKYRETVPDMADEELVIIPTAYAYKTQDGKILPL
ncbi:MAG: hypothetical protein ACT6FG_00335 [Methanosarcinaceae archaeon]